MRLWGLKSNNRAAVRLALEDWAARREEFIARNASAAMVDEAVLADEALAAEDPPEY